MWPCALQVDAARIRLLARLLPPRPSGALPPLPAATPPAPTAAAAAPATPAASSAPGGDAELVDEVDPAAAAAAAAVVGPCELQTSPLLDGLVSRQPLLLVANVDDLLDELAR